MRLYTFMLPPLNIPLFQQMDLVKRDVRKITFQWYYPFGISKYASGMTHIFPICNNAMLPIPKMLKYSADVIHLRFTFDR